MREAYLFFPIPTCAEQWISSYQKHLLRKSKPYMSLNWILSLFSKLKGCSKSSANPLVCKHRCWKRAERTNFIWVSTATHYDYLFPVHLKVLNGNKHFFWTCMQLQDCIYEVNTSTRIGIGWWWDNFRGTDITATLPFMIAGSMVGIQMIYWEGKLRCKTLF